VEPEVCERPWMLERLRILGRAEAFENGCPGLFGGEGRNEGDLRAEGHGGQNGGGQEKRERSHIRWE
jgi:hypothetical protein